MSMSTTAVQQLSTPSLVCGGKVQACNCLRASHVVAPPCESNRKSVNAVFDIIGVLCKFMVHIHAALPFFL